MKKKTQLYNPELITIFRERTNKYEMESYLGYYFDKYKTVEEANESFQSDIQQKLAQGRLPEYLTTYKAIPNGIYKGFAEYKNSGRGRSSVKFHYEIDGKYLVEMFLSDLSDWIYTLEPLTLSEQYFTFVKRGKNYGIKFILESDIPEDTKIMSLGEVLK